MHNAIGSHLPTNAQPVPEQRLLASFPHSLCTEHDAIWYRISLWPLWGQPMWLCPSQLLMPSSLLTGRACKDESPCPSKKTTWQQLKHQCAINVILILNPKHSTVPTITKKADPVPVETGTPQKHSHLYGSAAPHLKCIL